jgi:hypothetical protein
MMLTPGQWVHWRYSRRGGYGYTYCVPAIVESVTAQRVKLTMLHPVKIPTTRLVRPEHVETAHGKTEAAG